MKANFKLPAVVAGVLLLACAPGVSAAKVDPIYTHSGFAIGGYDPVAYHDKGEALKGSPPFSYQWRGATWLFSSTENLARFQADPERYAPQYGGYCAYAVSQGHTASIDPEAWKIVNGKLYLNYSKSVKSKWEQDVPGNIRKADMNWPGLHK